MSGPAVRGRESSAGVTAPALEWFFAEGATGTFFDSFILIANPNPAPAAVEVRFLAANGGVLSPLHRAGERPRHDLGR